jgi:hypothetical protein
MLVPDALATARVNPPQHGGAAAELPLDYATPTAPQPSAIRSEWARACSVGEITTGWRQNAQSAGGAKLISKCLRSWQSSPLGTGWHAVC